MPKVISVFNHKGGVSKTTTTFNIGWMLAELGHKVILVDADPQCNLTGVTLGLINVWPPDDEIENDPNDAKSQEYAHTQDKAQGFFHDNVERTLYGALKPAFESEPRLLEPVECIPVEGRPGLWILPGHLQLGEYEVTLSVAQEMSGSLLALRNVPGAVNYLLRRTAEALDADFVLVDMSPSLGALNQNIVATSDLLFVPTSPDFFSIMALRSLARILPRWSRWAEAASSNEVLRSATYKFPAPRLKFAGSVIQRYRLYRAPTSANPYGDPTRPFQKWIDQVANAINDEFAPALGKAGLLLPTEAYLANGIEQYVLGKIQEFNSLLPKSQEYRLPVFELTAVELQQVGIVLDGSLRQIESLKKIFRGIAEKLVSISLVEA
ncbi:MAG: ParA family protein [Pseudonocardiaceae bacterium]